MIACPDCEQLCGVRDAVLMNDRLLYRCPCCLSCFDVEEVLAQKDRGAGGGAPLPSSRTRELEEVYDDRSDTPTMPPDSDWNVVTPVIQPTHSFVDRAFRVDDVTVIHVESAPKLEILGLDRAAALGPRLAPPPLPEYAPLFTPAAGSAPFAMRLLEPSIKPAARMARLDSDAPLERDATTTEDPPISALMFTRRLVQGIAAGSAMMGLAAALSVFAARAEPLAMTHASGVRPSLAANFSAVQRPKSALLITGQRPESPPRPAEITPHDDEPAPPTPKPVAAASPAPREARAAATEPEALTAEADRAARAGDHGRARALYAQALSKSPMFVPARLGAANLDWDLGYRVQAKLRYGALVADAPQLAPAVARERAR